MGFYFQNFTADILTNGSIKLLKMIL